jgi:hypothetical protein
MKHKSNQMVRDFAQILCNPVDREVTLIQNPFD